MAAQNLLFMNVLRILTPEEINELITSSDGDSRVPLSELMDRCMAGLPLEEEEQGSAKILPFEKPSSENVEGSENEEQKEILIGQNVLDLIAKFSEDPSKYIKIPAHKRETLFDEKGDMRDTSSFIINEKNRFQECQAKLKSKEVIGLYKMSAAVDLEQEKALREDLEHTADGGVLVDKKQY